MREWVKEWSRGEHIDNMNKFLSALDRSNDEINKKSIHLDVYFDMSEWVIEWVPLSDRAREKEGEKNGKRKHRRRESLTMCQGAWKVINHAIATVWHNDHNKMKWESERTIGKGERERKTFDMFYILLSEGIIIT
jgi:hypothetical protein